MGLSTLKYSMYGVFTAAAVIGLIAIWQMSAVEKPQPFILEDDIFSNDTATTFESTQTLKKFSSSEELRAFLLKASQGQNMHYFGGERTTLGDVVFERAPAPMLPSQGAFPP